MRGSLLLVTGWLAAIAQAAAAQPAPAAAPAQGVTIEDLLQAETLGDVWFSPDGRRVMFARGRPIAQVRERGQDDEAIDRDRVMVADVSGGAAVQAVDFAPIHGQPWSPDGGGALMLSVRDGGYSLAYWDAASGRSRVLPGRATSSFPVFAWAGERLVYAAVADETVQQGARPQILQQLGPKWRAAWTGDQPQVTVSSANPLFKATTQPPGRLMIADLRSGQSHSLAEGDYAYGALSVSPDGRWLAAVREGELQADAISWTGRQGELQIFDLAGGSAALVRSFCDLDFAEAGLSWSPDGRRLLIGARRPGAARADTGLYVMDPAAGTARRLAGQGLDFMDPGVMAGGGLLPFGWVGARPAAIASRPGQPEAEGVKPAARGDYGETRGLRFDLYDLSGSEPRALTAFSRSSVRGFLAAAGRGDALVVADGGLWEVDPAAPPVRVTPRDFGTVAGFATDSRYPPPAPETAYHRDAAGERVSLLTVAAAGGIERRVLDLGSGRSLFTAAARDVLAAAPDQLTLARSESRGWSSSYLLQTPRGSRPLAEVNTALNARAVAPAQPFEFSYGGKALGGWLLLPPGAKPGAPLPAVVSVYGGEVYGADQPTLSKPVALMPVLNGQLLAAHGYAVIYPSTPLQAGADTDVMATLAGESVAAVDALAAKGLVDRNRVGVTGQSFGGYSTAAILARASDRFRAGVALAGIYDWSFSYGVPSLGDMLTDDGRDKVVETRMVEDGQIRLGEPFWVSPEAYIRNSPIYHVQDIDSPLLLLHGDLDMAVTGLPNALRMYNAMVRAGKHPALVRYWGEGHVAASAWAMRDQVARMLAWFDAYVKGPPPRGVADAPCGD